MSTPPGGRLQVAVLVAPHILKRPAIEVSALQTGLFALLHTLNACHGEEVVGADGLPMEGALPHGTGPLATVPVVVCTAGK